MYDIVCGMELEEETDFRVAYEGKPYFFCSQNCLSDFQASPKKFLKQEPIIKLERVWKIYTLGKVEVPVLRGLSMRIWSGDIVALVGPSGSGKSTVMNMIGALDMPTSGKVWIEVKDTSTLDENELANLRGKKIGFIFQQFNLIPSLSALENVMLPRILQGKTDSSAKERAGELLESVGLGNRLKHKPMELSGGEQQRVAIARAFMNNPDIILADEPTGNLDSETSDKVIHLLVDLWKKYKKTIIIVTHDPHVAEHAQRVLSFKDGHLILDHGMAEKMVWKEKTH